MVLGKLIVIEGLEGAGKSTIITKVVNLLEQNGIKTLTTREPGGTCIGELLRGIIKNPDYKGILADKTELLLLYASRIQLLEQVIKPAMQEGSWVVADRFELSTMAYQGGGRGLDQNLINQLSVFSLEGFKPDLTFFLDLSPEQGMKRARLRGCFDRIEQETMDFFNRVYQAYIQHSASYPNLIKIDASLSEVEVQKEVTKVLKQFIESV